MSGYERAAGFAPVFDERSELLILGSFPSVLSRRVDFYYGNPQNRFWGMLCGFFGESIPPDTAGKRAFLQRRHIALWDIVTECDVVGSADASIRGECIADLPALFGACPLRAVFCNGSKSYALTVKHFPQYTDMVRLLPSTSPANPRYRKEAWEAALADVFPRR